MLTFWKGLAPGSVWCSAMLFCYLGGCLGSSTPPGDTITIEAPANDTVAWQAAPTLDACCPSPQCASAGVATGSGNAGANGLVTIGTFSNMEDDTSYTIVSIGGPTPCSGFSNVIACEANFTLVCNAEPANSAAGHIQVTGSEEMYCRSHDSSLNDQPGACPAGSDSDTVCDTGGVSLTINGQTVSVSLSCASTPLSVASALAIALDENATLGTQFVAAANGPIAYVHALNAGSQYNYSWTSSSGCSATIMSIFGQCSFTAGLSPAGALSGGS
jgi:hypothetical protein